MARYEPASWNASLNLGPAKIANSFTCFNPTNTHTTLIYYEEILQFCLFAFNVIEYKHSRHIYLNEKVTSIQKNEINASIRLEDEIFTKNHRSLL